MTAAIWTPESLDDLERLQQFLIAENPGASAAAAHRVVTSVEQLSSFPRSGTSVPSAPEIRELHIPFGNAAYVLRYRLLDSDQPLVLSVTHSRESRH